jgi:hypothetical protein
MRGRFWDYIRPAIAGRGTARSAVEGRLTQKIGARTEFAYPVIVHCACKLKVAPI